MNIASVLMLGLLFAKLSTKCTLDRWKPQDRNTLGRCWINGGWDWGLPLTDWGNTIGLY